MRCWRGRERPSPRYLRLPLSLLAVLGALVALAGCGGSSSPLHAVRTAATNTLALTTQSTLTSTGARLFGGNAGTILGRAQYSFPKGLGYEALQVPAGGRRAAGTAYVVFMPQQLWSKPVVSSALPKGHLWITATYSDARPESSTARSIRTRVGEHEPAALPRGDRDGSGRSLVLGPRGRQPRAVQRVRHLGRSGSVDRGDERPEPFEPRCSKSSPRSARVEAPTRARGCRS